MPSPQPLTLTNLTGRLAQLAGARGTVTQVANPLARDIAVADGDSRSLLPQRRRCWQPALAPIPVPDRMLLSHRRPSASSLEWPDVAADRRLPHHHQPGAHRAIDPDLCPLCLSFIAALAARNGRNTTVATPRMWGVYPS